MHLPLGIDRAAKLEWAGIGLPTSISSVEGLRMTRTRPIFFSLLVAFVLAACAGGFAQTSPVSLNGAVVCQGEPVPGVSVRAENSTGGAAITVYTDESGRYVLPLPAAGAYHLRVEMFGFAPAQRDIVVAPAEGSLHADFSLSLGSASSPSSRDDNREIHVAVPATASLEVRSPQPATSYQARQSIPSALSADVPMEFVFIEGQLAQPVVSASATNIALPRQGRYHGGAYYNGANSALDASPYALHGLAADKPEYAQSAFGASFGGPPPFGDKQRTFFFVDYSGGRSGRPFNSFATVATKDVRDGDFSAGTQIIYDPATGQPFPGNRIPVARMSAAARGLLGFIPLPNGDGMAQNFRATGSTDTLNNNFSASMSRVSSAIAQSGQQHAPLRHNLGARLGYHNSDTNLANVFPGLGGNNAGHGWDGGFSYTLMKGFYRNSFQAGFNQNSFALSDRFRQDEAATLGIGGVSHDSFDWGLPQIAFSHYTGLVDVTPQLRTDRNLTFSDLMSWTNGRHNLKWGGEFRRIDFDKRTSSDARGRFFFTGLETAALSNGSPVAGTGSDWADFLLGLPQETHVSYASDPYAFSGDAWSVYFVDDWRVAKNLSLNLGVRYEYASPISEGRNRLVTLDAPPDFGAVAVVQAGSVGPYSGRYPRSIVGPDRNNFAPKIGLAWRASEHFIVRVGYGIDYNTSMYSGLAEQFAYQPPFAVMQTGIASPGQALTLTNGFAALAPNSIANSFGASRELPLGYAQVWTLEVQRELPAGIMLTVGYNGSQGTHLGLLRAPNRTATGLRLLDAEPFLWQSAEGSSILHGANVRARKRLQGGLSMGASYAFSRSIDNVPNLGGGGLVPQDENNLAAERSLSSFDQRHRFSADYSYQLPFGKGGRWLTESGLGNGVLGNWSWSGAARLASGMPLTARVLGNYSDVNSGGFGSLRADVTGMPVQLSHPTVERFFNTGAFALPPAGQYGNAGRNTIIGPGTLALDASMQKAILFSDGRTLQFRIQTSNPLNTPQYTMVDTGVNSPSFGQVVGVGSMRTMQLSLRFRY